VRRTTSTLLTLTFIAAAIITGATEATSGASRPNIVLIFADDVGLGDVHCTGGPVHTPNIDKLASGGMMFNCCYSTPMCGPSRCELLTGRYPFRTGLVSNYVRSAADPSREVMIPTVLAKAGYVTASVGKWGQIQLAPGEWGFDEFLAFPGSGCYWRDQTTYYIVSGKPGEHTQFDHVIANRVIDTYTVKGQHRELAEGQYLPDVMQQYVAGFIARHKDRPCFLYYPMSNIHRPIVRTPDSDAGTERELYRPNIEYMDKLVGQLVNELDRYGLRKKTLVMFVGDNGTAKIFADLATVNGRSISGWKSSMLEGGSRVPLVVNWPGTTPAGRVNNDLTDLSDFFVTIAELAGAKLPKGVTLDGHSFASQIRGEKGSPREWVYVELNGKSYACDKQFKLTGDGHLFDLSEAPFKEIPVPADSTDSKAVAARRKLQAVLDAHPAAAAHHGFRNETTKQAPAG
jgi:arylsulfatase A